MMIPLVKISRYFYNLERLHVVGIHNMCEQKFTTLAVGMVLVLTVVPLMNMRACRALVRGPAGSPR